MMLYRDSAEKGLLDDANLGVMSQSTCPASDIIAKMIRVMTWLIE